MADGQTQAFEPGTLWRLTREQTATALACGALQPIPTDSERIEHGGVRFLVRVVERVTHKDVALQLQQEAEAVSGAPVNPFLPYDEDLWVTDLSPTHVCLLNKFPALEHHLLIVTRTFEVQEALLTAADFTALWTCIREIDGLGFYNAGEVAGASQRHKHLQLVPLPLVPEGPPIPVAPAIAAADFDGPYGTISLFPFRHALARVEQTWQGEELLVCYNELRRIVGGAHDAAGATSPAYNLLLTREWMLVVPRARERCDTMSVNALGFAGALLVRDASQLAWLKTYGPMRVLQHVGVADDPR